MLQHVPAINSKPINKTANSRSFRVARSCIFRVERSHHNGSPQKITHIPFIDVGNGGCSMVLFEHLGESAKSPKEHN